MHKGEFDSLRPKVVLGIAAHPDDLDFGASGTMATFAAQGAEIYYLILTDGSKGSSDYDASPVELAKTREAEQRTALEIIGSKSDRVYFLNHPDGELEITMDIKAEVVKIIRTVKPDVVVTMDPSVLYSARRGFINHPDHRAAGQIALDAVFPLARDHMAFPQLFAEGYKPHKVKTMLLTNFEQHNFFVDITDVLDVKLAALAAHASQVPDMEGTTKMVKEWSRAMGEEAGYMYAEAFMRIDVG